MLLDCLGNFQLDGWVRRKWAFSLAAWPRSRSLRRESMLYKLSDEMELLAKGYEEPYLKLLGASKLSLNIGHYLPSRSRP